MDDEDHEASAVSAHMIRAARVPRQLTATAVETVRASECWTLLESVDLGRLAVADESGEPDIFPMNYRVHDGCLYVRSAPGAKLVDLARHPSVAFEADGTDDGSRWSVVVRGRATRLYIDEEIEESGVLDLVSESPTGKHNYLRIRPRTLAGRRFRPVHGEAEG